MTIHAETMWAMLGTTLLLNAFERTPIATHFVLRLLKNEMCHKSNETEQQQFIMSY